MLRNYVQKYIKDFKQSPGWTLFGTIALLSVVVFGGYNIVPRAYPEGATSALNSKGYSDVEILGAGWLGCRTGYRSSAYFNTRFRATSPNGNTVEGRVCSGGIESIVID